MALPAYPAVDVIVSFYKNAALVAPLFESLGAVASELRASSCSIIAINDSPEDLELDNAMQKSVAQLSECVPCSMICNERNLGFVRSVNKGLSVAIESEHDVILLNSDTIVFPAAISELRRVAYIDPMIGFVSPRSNNATICSLPQQKEFSHVRPTEAFENFQSLSKHLPEYHYAPTAVGFCLYIKFEVLEEFGLFDESYGAGYNEENDLIMRANRTGYRAALANRAFVYHKGEASFSMSDSWRKELLDSKNAELLNQRYPEYSRSVSDYLNGAHYQGERMLAALLPDREGRLDVVFDFSGFGPYHNGTFEGAKRILQCASETWREHFNLYAMASEEVIQFHELDQLRRVAFVPPDSSRLFAIAFRFGQPFDYQHLFRMSQIGVLNIYDMLDTIAFDCLYLNNADLPLIWETVFEHADGVLYISEFVQEQFRRRFAFRSGLREMVSYLSLDLQDYAKDADSGDEVGSHILVIGNSFAHKHVPATVDALSRAFPRERIVALSGTFAHQNVISYPSGNLTKARMQGLVENAKFVVYPSMYEGFGIPVLESLACRKPVLARSIPVFRDIRARMQAGDNLILYSSTNDLVKRLRVGFPAWKHGTGLPNGVESGNWRTTTRRMGDFFGCLLDEWSFRGNLLPRLDHMRLLKDRTRNTGEVTGSYNKPADLRHEAMGLSPEVSSLREEVRCLTQSLSEMTVKKFDADAQIADLRGSYSWRLTAPLRWLGEIYLRNFAK